MTYLKFAVLAPLVLAVNILSWILAPALALLSMALGPNLPWPLTWFYSHDDDLDGGQHQVPDLFPPGARGFELFTQRIRWIWRNPGYGFAADIAGIPAAGVTVVETGDMAGGIRQSFVSADGRLVGFAYRREYQWSESSFMLIWFGWRYPLHVGATRYMLKLDFNPFRRR